MKLDFQTWLEENQPKETMIYRNAWWNTYVFWRDAVIPLMTEKRLTDFSKLNEFEQYVNDCHKVVGIHTSKSIVHPVLKIVYKGITIVFRYNFYDYEITVVGDIPLSIPRDYIPNEKDSFFYQGFPEEYKINKKYTEENNKAFSLKLSSNYDFYAFLVFIKNEIDIAREAIE